MLFAFHIIFAVAGMGMPVLMVVAEAAYRKTGKPVYQELAKRWARGTGVLFAVGAVSGTVLRITSYNVCYTKLLRRA